MINNGNRTEWSPIRSVIIRVINKIGRPRSGSPICLITSMITDRIGRHEVLLPINHIYNKIRERKRRKRTGEGIDNSFICEIRLKKSLFKCNWSISARALTRTVQLLRHDAYTVQLHCPTVLLMLKSWLVIANQIREFCYSYDYGIYLPVGWSLALVRPTI